MAITESDGGNFNKNKSVISRHIKNIFAEGELDENSVVAFFATTAADLKVYDVEYFNLDMIISVGYRVNSKRGVQFRKWASSVLKAISVSVVFYSCYISECLGLA